MKDELRKEVVCDKKTGTDIDILEKDMEEFYMRICDTKDRFMKLKSCVSTSPLCEEDSAKDCVAPSNRVQMLDNKVDAFNCVLTEINSLIIYFEEVVGRGK